MPHDWEDAISNCNRGVSIRMGGNDFLRTEKEQIFPLLYRLSETQQPNLTRLLFLSQDARVHQIPYQILAISTLGTNSG